MKLRPIFGVAVLVFCAAVAIVSAQTPFYRCWSGFKLSNLTQDDFVTALNKVFMGATVAVSKVPPNALVSYQVYVAPRTHGKAEPDEIALIQYSSQEGYNEMYSTAAGKAYQALHAKYFAIPPSHSRVPTLMDLTAPSPPFNVSTAWDVYGYPGTWNDMKPYFTYWTNKGDSQAMYLEILARAFDMRISSYPGRIVPGLISWILVIESDYYYEHRLWLSEEARLAATTSYQWVLADGWLNGISVFNVTDQLGQPWPAAQADYDRFVQPKIPVY